MSNDKAKKLQEIFHRQGNPVVHVSAPTPSAARMLERAGFEYIFLGGDVTFGTMLGKPGTFLDVSEKVFIAKYFVSAVDLPVVMDCDEVCGRGPAFVEHATEEYIGVGLAGMDIDDRWVRETRGAGKVEHENPIEGVISTQEMVEKISAAAETKRALNPDFLLRVRCYDFHLGTTPLDVVIERCKAYESAGADVLYLGGVRNPEDTRAVLREVKVPCTVPGTWVTYDMAKELGLAEVRYPYEFEMAMHAAAWEHITDLRERGQQAVTDIRKRYEGKNNPYMAAPGMLRVAPE